VTKDFEISVKVRNHRLLAKMREFGIETAPELARKVGLSAAVAYDILNMVIPGRAIFNGAWRPSVQKIADYFGCMPEDIIPEPVRENKLARNTGSFHLDAYEMEDLLTSLKTVALPADKHLDGKELASSVHDALLKLPPRLERVLRMRFGIGCEEKTLDEIGLEWGITKGRVREVEAKALRLLKHPARSKKLHPFLENVE
jgi:RNA polymerase sigma factor (sigma-70 family)